MTLKFIALASTACSIALFIPSLLLPNDPYFDLLISPNPIVMSVRLIVCALMVAVALKPSHKFKYREFHPVILALAGLLAGFGIVGVVDPTVDYDLFNVLKPLDYMFALIASSFMLITYFEYARGRRKLPKAQIHISLPEWNLRRSINARLAGRGAQLAKNL